jgi:methylmalonyl-CoA/ethylmalonyl-CoA epimerase
VAFAERHGAALVATLERVLGFTVDSSEEAPGFIERMLGMDNCALQALEATGDGVVARFLDRRGPGLHHIALEVPDLDGTLEHLSSHGIRLIDEKPRIGGGGHRIAFAHPDAFGGVLVEFVEVPVGRED